MRSCTGRQSKRNFLSAISKRNFLCLLFITCQLLLCLIFLGVILITTPMSFVNPSFLSLTGSPKYQLSIVWRATLAHPGVPIVHGCIHSDWIASDGSRDKWITVSRWFGLGWGALKEYVVWVWRKPNPNPNRIQLTSRSRSTPTCQSRSKTTSHPIQFQIEVISQTYKNIRMCPQKSNMFLCFVHFWEVPWVLTLTCCQMLAPHVSAVCIFSLTTPLPQNMCKIRRTCPCKSHIF